MLPVFLNHFFLVLDAETYRQIVNSTFIRELFCVCEERSTLAGGGKKWAGFYLYGKETYFEFFNIEDQVMPNLEDIGIAYGLEKEGDINKVRLALEEKTGRKTTKELRTRLNEGENIPWFQMAYYADEIKNTLPQSWFMEYHPDFLTNWSPFSVNQLNSIDRASILEHYQKKVAKEANHRLLGDVTEIHLNLEKKDIDYFKSQFEFFGFAVEKKENQTIFFGNNIAFQLSNQISKKKGISQFTMQLNKDVEEQSFSFGKNSKLVLNQNKAIWSFI